jgi:endonuclease/exonuclease/phosphatase family metal-dependent hydrolase
MHHRLLTAIVFLSLPAQTHAQAPIDLDGEVTDWPQGVRVLADQEHIYVRLEIPQTTSLQSSKEAIHLAFDLDSNATTGASIEGVEALGVDLEITISPFWGNSRAEGFSASRIVAYPNKQPVTLSIPQLDLMWSPTHASKQFELRFDRDIDTLKLLHPASNATLSIEARDPSGTILWQREDAAFSMPVTGVPIPKASLPDAPDGSLRILSWNVHWGSPHEDPETFDRIFRALQPDILLLQEWDDRQREIPVHTVDELVEWFNESLPDAKPWHVARGNARGTVIVSRFPLERFTPKDVMPLVEGDSTARKDRAIRFIGARIDTPLGDFVTGSFHLKCCGNFGGSEDQQRVAEARGIQQVVNAEVRRAQPAGVFLAGDMNLVGSSDPLLAMIQHTDIDGSDLANANAPILGEAIHATWAGNDTRFPRGKLDFALISDSSLEVLQSFVLDIRLLSDSTLESSGLGHDDRNASDHLPLVFDIALRHDEKP